MAADYEWNHTGTGLWTDTSSWSPTAPTGGPGVGDSATINQGTVEINAIPVTVDALSVGDVGILNLSNAAVSTGAYGIGGIANHSGGSFETTSMQLSADNATAILHLFDETSLWVKGHASIGYGGGAAKSAVINQTSGVFKVGDVDSAASLTLAGHGYGAENAFQAIYNMQGGTFECYGLVQMTGSEFSDSGLAQWNIHEGSVVNIQPASNSPDYYIGVCIGGMSLSDFMGGRAELNIYGGEINVQGNIIGGSHNSHLNIYGSKADIHVENMFNSMGYEQGSLDVNFMLDSHGTTTINASGDIDLTYSLSPDVEVNIPAFFSLKTATTDLVSVAGTITNFTVKDNTPFHFIETRPTVGDDTVVRLTMSGDHDSWNLVGTYEVFDAMNPDGKESGALKVTGSESVPLHAVFTGLDGLADVLVEYLNSAVVETGMSFSKIDETTLLLDGDYLGDGYAWFGWDLSGFNSGGYDVKLYQFNTLLEPFDTDVPEPSTWAMLLLGGAAMVGMRIRRRK